MSTHAVHANVIPKLDDAFWQKMWETAQSAATSPDAVHLAMASFQGEQREHFVAGVLKKFEPIHREIFDRVRAELEPQNVLYASQPTKFQLRYLDAMKKHNAEVKREFLGPLAKRKLPDQKSYADYDVEADIAYCEKAFEEKRRELYGREVDFLKAFDEGRLEDAEALLRAIMVMRKSNASSAKRQEATSWLSMLALKQKSLPLFVESLNAREPDSSMVIESLATALQTMIYGCIVHAFATVPSGLGIREIATIGQPAFSDKHIGPYVKGAILEIAELMSVPIPTTESGFRELVKQVFVRRIPDYLKVNPMLLVIQPVWK
jgi:hypothetical protein